MDKELKEYIDKKAAEIVFEIVISLVALFGIVLFVLWLKV